VALQAPPSPDYIPGLEEPEHAPPSPDYVPGPEHADNEIVAEDQTYAEDASPIVQSPEYEESSEDDEDDDMDIEADEDEEEEHPAPADSVVVASTAADQAPSAEETEPFETDESAATPTPHPAYRMIARISIPAPVPMPAWTDSEIVRLLAMSSPPASPLSHWSSPPPQIHFPPLPLILSPPSPKRLGIALGPGYNVGESSSAAAARPAGGLRVDYGIIAMMDREIMSDPEREMLEIRELQVADRRRQTVISELLRIDHKRSTEITELRTASGTGDSPTGIGDSFAGIVTALQGQQGLAGGPTQP
nr:hypothetical protein [Tanacetum cinerariifolium]